jgi:hypothetical protein
LARNIALGVVAAFVLVPGLAASATAPAGSYECWYFSTPRPLYNFSVSGKGYSDSEGNEGSITLAGGQMKFVGANLDGETAVYKPGNLPTISFLDEQGAESFFCQLVP